MTDTRFSNSQQSHPATPLYDPRSADSIRAGIENHIIMKYVHHIQQTALALAAVFLAATTLSTEKRGQVKKPAMKRSKNSNIMRKNINYIYHKAKWQRSAVLFMSVLVMGHAVAAQDISLLTQPQSMKVSDQSRRIGPALSVSADGGTKELVESFARQLRQSTGWAVPVKKSGDLRFSIDPKQIAAYRLNVTTGWVDVIASNSQNLCYGFQTFLQLCPPEIYSRTPAASLAQGWAVPCLEIEDSPRFAWRGILIDVARAFQTKEEMLKLIDSMAMVKLNVLHWHLTDDQGWRPEIAGYPKLTSGTDKRYTREDLVEIVRYATERGITILPEIDVPGHSAAVARAYPELCVARTDGKGRTNVYDVSNPAVYEFLDKVIGELAAIFPGEYIHLGADEVNTGCWKTDPACATYMEKHGIKNTGELQAHFVEKVRAIIEKHGRKAIAWDEALHGSSDKDLAIMSWRGVKPGIEAARRGHKVVLCPVSALYYDRAQSRSKLQPEGYSANTVVMSQSYFFEPAIPTLDDTTKSNILGAQGCVWGAKIHSGEQMQQQVMPRGAALAESLWSTRKSLDWNSFLMRLTVQRARFEAKGVAFWWEPETTPIQVGGWESIGPSEYQEIDVSKWITRAGLYEFLFHYQQGTGTFNILKAELLLNGVAVAEDVHASTGTIEPRGPNQFYQLKLKDLDPHGKYSLRYRIDAVKDGCSGVVMLIPPLKEGEYAPQRSPETKANVSGQKQPDEL